MLHCQLDSCAAVRLLNVPTLMFAPAHTLKAHGHLSMPD